MSSSGMVNYLLDQLQDPDVAARAMFGGHGVYRAGKMFGIVYEDEVYMKVNAQEARSSPRTLFRPRRSQTLWSYRLVSADDLEDPDKLKTLATRAQRAAMGQSSR